ncbi:MAG: class I SAM-dependent methyltransferase [Marinirhabdus sp.]|nr:class I SAM-dependent methyltransferase [Marinirhabdus sp.]
MEIDDQIKFYDERWGKKSYLNSLKLRRASKIMEYFTVVKRKLKLPRTIDLGCGDGRFIAFIGEFTPAEGIELSEEAVRLAKEAYPHTQFHQGNVLEFPFEKEAYDLVISQEVIEHIEEQPKYIAVAADVLKPGGYLILTTPNKKVFDHMEGGNWSNQPIEKVLTPTELKRLVAERFDILTYESIIMNFGNLGYFKLINYRVLIGGCRRLGLEGFREWILSKLGFGLHQCILAKKK